MAANMTDKEEWALTGTIYECCRREGQCSLVFGRDLWNEPCTSFGVFDIREGYIEHVDMSGVVMVMLGDGIGPKLAESGDGVERLAVYISDKVSDAQKRVLEPFAELKFCFMAKWKNYLGTKFVSIEIVEDNRSYHITMPHGEMMLDLTLGGDGKNPMFLENFRDNDASNVRLCNTRYWNYHDYGIDLAFRDTSGMILDYSIRSGRPLRTPADF